MKKLEKILGILFITAILFRFNLIPASSLMLAISLTFLALIYFPLGFAFFNKIPLKKVFKKESYAGLSALQIIRSVVLGIGLSEICAGTLTKLIHLPYTKLHLFVGFFFICLALMLFLVELPQPKSIFYKTIVSRMVIFGMLSLFLLNVSDLTLIKIQYRNHPLYIQAFENYLKNRENKELQIKLDIEYHRATYPKNEFDIYMRFEHPEYKEN